MKTKAHTGKRKEINMDAQARKRASLPSAGSGRASASPGSADAPQGAECGKGCKRVTPTMAKQAALAIEAGGSLLAQAIDRMQAATDDEARKHVWKEIGMILGEHADAMLIFLVFCGPHIDRDGGAE